MSSTRSVPRLMWSELPDRVVAAFTELLGSPVVTATSQEEGFSPGLAARCELATGGLVFLKATATSVNVHSREMMVHEALINRAIPAHCPTPSFLGSIEVDEWFGLAFGDVEGRLPATPWEEADLELVLDAVGSLDVPASADVPPLTEMLGPAFEGWSNLAASDADLRSTEPWLDPETIRWLADLTSSWQAHCPPERIVHADIRADNLLIDRDNRVVVIDWANAGLGPSWLDTVFMIPSISMQGGPRPEELWRRSVHGNAMHSKADDVAVDVLVAAVAGYFTEFARRPPVAEIPMLRAFQEAQGVWARAWLAHRLGFESRA